MADKQFLLNLGKLVIAAAWVDGELSLEEIHALKDLLFQVPDMTGDDWHSLEIYMDHPVSAEERKRLLDVVVGSIRWAEEKTLVIDTLTRLVEADGEVKADEVAVLAHIKKDVEGASTGLLGHVSQAIRGAVRKRKATLSRQLNREGGLDDYIKNRVFYYLSAELDKRGAQFAHSDEQVRKLCLAGGMMAQVAWVDSEMAESEKQMIQQVFEDNWNLSKEEAGIISEVSCSPGTKGLDLVRLTRYFFNGTTHQERLSFVESLFKVANAAHKTSFEEIQTIEFIAKGLRIPHKQFIDAKLTIPREDRGGL